MKLSLLFPQQTYLSDDYVLIKADSLVYCDGLRWKLCGNFFIVHLKLEFHANFYCGMLGWFLWDAGNGICESLRRILNFVAWILKFINFV